LRTRQRGSASQLSGERMQSASAACKG
jgi:hypothetical protein